MLLTLNTLIFTYSYITTLQVQLPVTCRMWPDFAFNIGDARTVRPLQVQLNNDSQLYTTLPRLYTAPATYPQIIAFTFTHFVKSFSYVCIQIKELINYY